MRVAVVTPYYKESTDLLRRCHDSVVAQTYSDIRHMMVADGDPHPWCRHQDIDHITMPASHGDAGATPRAIGAISAFSRGYDAVAFLDADNWFEPDHIRLMVEKMSSSGADVVAATRKVMIGDQGRYFVDLHESNGRDFTDTNCMFISRKALHLLTYWVTEPGQKLWSDRAFWNAIKQSGLSVAICEQATVAYVTKWAAHYVNVGMEPPPDSVWIVRDDAGNLSHITHKKAKERKNAS